MQIKINDDFGIKTDNYNYIVCKIKNVEKDGESKEKWSKISSKPYAKTLEHALNNYVKYRQMSYDDIKSLVELVELNKELVQELEQLSETISGNYKLEINVIGEEPLKNEQNAN